jgi:hypothetical protein
MNLPEIEDKNLRKLLLLSKSFFSKRRKNRNRVHGYLKGLNSGIMCYILSVLWTWLDLLLKLDLSHMMLEEKIKLSIRILIS